MEITQLRRPCLQSDDELLVTLDTVDAALSELHTYRLQLTADMESRGLATRLGAGNTIELLSLRHRRNPGDIRRDLKYLKHLPKYEAVIAALPHPHTDDDDTVVEVAVLTPDLARVIVETLEKAPPTVPVELLLVAEEQMIEAARHLTPDGLRHFGRQVLDRLDTDGPEPAEEAAAQAEKLWIRPVDHGVKFGGFLAGANAELFKTAIHDLAKPHKTIAGDPDPRPRDKRQADALTTILEAAVGNTTSGPGIPHITVTIDFADLKAQTSEAVGELVFGDNLSASAVRLLACDAFILPIVLGTESQPLDVGMDYRFVTRPIRRALIRRDKGCVICKAPPSHCHAHHIIHWIDGGPTSITNLVLLCGAHHRAVHAGHWSVKISNGVIQVTRPDWTIPTPGRLTLSPQKASPTPDTTPSPAPSTAPTPGTAPTPRTASTPGTPPPWGWSTSGPPPPWGWAAPKRTPSLTLDGTAADWLAPTTTTTTTTTTAWSIGVSPGTAQPDRLRATTLTPANSPTTSLPRLMAEASADLNPWGETGTPSTGP